jgi:hypothetical protein
MGDKINIWIIDSGDEFAREAFKNWESRKASSSNTDRLTTCVWSQLGINRIMKFMFRYKEIAQDLINVYSNYCVGIGSFLAFFSRLSLRFVPSSLYHTETAAVSF